MRIKAMFAVIGLSACCLFGFASVIGGVEQEGTPTTFLVAFDGVLTAEKESLVRDEGGSIVKVLPELSGVVAASDDPAVVGKLKKEGWNVQEDHLIQAPVPDALHIGEFLKSGTVEQDLDESWSYHWDMQRIMAEDEVRYENGQAMEKGNTTSVKVIALIGSGVTAKQTEIRERLLGGSNFVPAGTASLETGDPSDIRDRIGSGTEEALQLAESGGAVDKFRAYRVYGENGASKVSWLLNALLQAVRDQVDVIYLSAELAQAIHLQQSQVDEPKSDSDLIMRALELVRSRGIVIEV